MTRESTTLRRKMLWLIGVRFVIMTILLGSGLLVQVRTPGLWPVGPFQSADGQGITWPLNERRAGAGEGTCASSRT